VQEIALARDIVLMMLMLMVAMREEGGAPVLHAQASSHARGRRAAAVVHQILSPGAEVVVELAQELLPRIIVG
jgi:hypothetical protein